jgi:sugar O-acyltransferase (sialic acid O-acetyltransferase NeuD family)
VKVVIFGNQKYASLVWYWLTHDSPHEVVGFTTDLAYVKESSLHSLPVIAFEEVERHFPPESIAMFAPLGPRYANRIREEKHRAGKAKGYRFISYVSSRAVTSPDLVMGENCMVAEAAMLRPFVQIGDGVLVNPGVNISHHVRIGDNCFFAAEACIGGSAIIGSRCFLGLNSTVRDGVTVASRCIIGAGAVVTEDTEENGIYFGVPAKRRPGESADQRDQP